MAGFVFIVIILFVLISSLDKKKQINRNLSSYSSTKRAISPKVTVVSKSLPTSNNEIKTVTVDGPQVNKTQNENAASQMTTDIESGNKMQKVNNQ